jgi:DNA-binding NtrC family response regulator
MMEHKTILYITDGESNSNSALAELEEMGYEIVSANSPTEGVALLYVMHSVAAVVLDNRSKEQASFDVTESLREIRPDVPLMLQCSDQIDSSSSSTAECMSTDKLTCALHHLLTAEPVVS